MSFHNRSVDMLLSWMNSQQTTHSLYKKVKNKLSSLLFVNNNLHIDIIFDHNKKLEKNNIREGQRKEKWLLCLAAWLLCQRVPCQGFWQT